MHCLNIHFEELARPVRELGRAFRGDVLALLSDEQRQAALLRTNALATKHGLAAEEQDAALLGLEK